MTCSTIRGIKILSRRTYIVTNCQSRLRSCKTCTALYVISNDYTSNDLDVGNLWNSKKIVQRKLQSVFNTSPCLAEHFDDSSIWLRHGQLGLVHHRTHVWVGPTRQITSVAIAAELWPWLCVDLGSLESAWRQVCYCAASKRHKQAALSMALLSVKTGQPLVVSSLWRKAVCW